MLCVREVMNNLTEGQMLFNMIGKTIFKILKSFPVVEKFMSRSLETELVHLTGTGVVHRNRNYILERKGEERRGG